MIKALRIISNGALSSVWHYIFAIDINASFLFDRRPTQDGVEQDVLAGDKYHLGAQKSVQLLKGNVLKVFSFRNILVIPPDESVRTVDQICRQNENFFELLPS